MVAQIHSFALTDIGCQRDRNEDQFLLSALCSPKFADRSRRCDSSSLVARELALFGVADGLGGQPGGAIASETAVEAIAGFVQANEHFIRDSRAAWQLANLMRRGFLDANRAIESQATGHPGRFGMSTTLTAALIRYPDLVVSHVGDSRCYLSRRGELQQLTTDQTVAELYRRNDQTVDIAQSPWKHVLWGYLGNRGSGLDVDSHIGKLEPRDWLLLVTDGLTRYVDDGEIQQAIDHAASPRELCRTLRETAIERGGSDNVTIVACNWMVPADSQNEIVTDVACSGPQASADSTGPA